jgi:hypothetical protein
MHAGEPGFVGCLLIIGVCDARGTVGISLAGHLVNRIVAIAGGDVAGVCSCLQVSTRPVSIGGHCGFRIRRASKPAERAVGEGAADVIRGRNTRRRRRCGNGGQVVQVVIRVSRGRADSWFVDGSQAPKPIDATVFGNTGFVGRGLCRRRCRNADGSLLAPGSRLWRRRR